MTLNRAIIVLLLVTGVCRSAARAQATPREVARPAAPATQPADISDVEVEEMAQIKIAGRMSPRNPVIAEDKRGVLQRGPKTVAPIPLSLYGEAGATTQPRPSLYFYLPISTDKPVVATLNQGKKTLKQWALPDGGVAGIYALTFEASDAPLDVSDDYEWFIEVRHYDAHSKNPKSKSQLSRVDADAGPAVRDAGPAERVVQLAESGLYYDAVDQLLRSPVSALHESTLRSASREREALLKALNLKRSVQEAPAPVRGSTP